MPFELIADPSGPLSLTTGASEASAGSHGGGAPRVRGGGAPANNEEMLTDLRITRPRPRTREPAILLLFACPRTTRHRYRSPTIGPSSVSGRTSTCPSSRPTRSWRGSIPSSPRRCSAVRRCRFRSRSSSRRFDGPDFARALELARASAEYLEVRDGAVAASPRAVLSAGRRQAARPVRDRRALRRDRGAGRRSAGAVRARAVAAAALVPDPVTSADVPHGRTDRPAEGPADARRGHQAARGGIQHVLRRPAAAAAVGDARPRRGDDQAATTAATSPAPPIASGSRCCSRASRR